MLRTPVVVLALSAALALTACGSSSAGTQSSVAPTTPATTPATTPTAQAVAVTTVAASAVPAVTGAQGTKPTIAKPTAPAPTTVLAHDVIPGTGAAVTAGSTATVNYTLALYSTGALVQSSYGSQAFTFQVEASPEMVIAGFDAGVVGMKAGGRRELIIPAAYGYQDHAQPGIPANSTLIFVVDVVSVG